MTTTSPPQKRNEDELSEEENVPMEVLIEKRRHNLSRLWNISVE